MLVLLFVYALAVSVFVPAFFLLAGPVRERRALLGVTYAAVFLLAWCAALLLGFLSPLALAAGAAAMATLGAVAAWYSYADERLLARFDARLDSPRHREEALDEVRARILEIGHETERVVALMEMASYPIRRLIERGEVDDAWSIVMLIEQELGPRLGCADRSELERLAALCLLHLGRSDEALARVACARATNGAPEELDAIEAVVRASRREIPRAELLIARAQAYAWLGRSRDLVSLARAHVSAARGRHDEAIRFLRALRDTALRLAHVVPGPATELAVQLRAVDGPYR